MPILFLRFTNLFSACCFATDFKTARALTNSEVAKVLEQKRSRFQDLGKQPSSDFLKAYQYVNKVKCFKDDAVVAQVRQYACCSGRTHAPRAPFPAAVLRTPRARHLTRVSCRSFAQGPRERSRSRPL